MENKQKIILVSAIGILLVAVLVITFMIFKGGKNNEAELPGEDPADVSKKTVEEQMEEVQRILDEQSKVQQEQNVEQKPVEQQIEEVQKILDEQSKTTNSTSTSSSSSSSSSSTKSVEDQMKEVQAILDAQK